MWATPHFFICCCFQGARLSCHLLNSQSGVQLTLWTHDQGDVGFSDSYYKAFDLKIGEVMICISTSGVGDIVKMNYECRKVPDWHQLHFSAWQWSQIHWPDWFKIVWPDFFMIVCCLSFLCWLISQSSASACTLCLNVNTFWHSQKDL